ncbi:MAG TPA: ATP-binding protein [Candidatus Binataceae bacterium]|nr:ATP-binding protein [Candidatus Binataceae bacterium]
MKLEEEDKHRPRDADSKRRRRERIAVAAATVILVIFAAAQTSLPPLSHHTSLSSNLAVILLFDLSVLLLGLLLFLVTRNIAKVIFERRRGLLGSKLQARLVFGFVAVALLPSAFLFYVAESFLRSNIDALFNPEYERVLDDSMEIAKTYYLNSANEALHYARLLAEQVASQKLLDGNKRAELKRFVETKQQEYNLGTVEVFSGDRSLLVLALSPRVPTGTGIAPDSPLLTRTLSGHSTTHTEAFGKADIIRGTAPVYWPPESETVIGAVVVDYFVPRSLAKHAATISQSFEDYLQLRILKQPIFHSYVLVLALIGLVVVLLASWYGVYLARGITGPIKLLAGGTHAIGGGDLDYEIQPMGEDEIGQLVRSFNQMTADLRASRAELERRRRYTETLLRNVSAGVVALDRDNAVRTINPCAERLLGVTADGVLNRNYSEAFSPELTAALEEIIVSLPNRGDFRSSIKLGSAGETELTTTATPLYDEDGGKLGIVLFFEDVSQIAKVERMEAWREVARRIAHEIKNPLTPIQLSAERLRRQMGAQPNGGAALLDECTRTILSEVEDLKHLVNEFSGFARMPHLNPVLGDLNALAEETTNQFREAHPQVEFVLDLDRALPAIAIDREALKRALVNLIDNAITASASSNGSGERMRIEVRTALERSSGVVTLEVCDNGPGVDPRLRTRIFEPYFSTKQGGGGLGLAIVSAIVADHHGFVRMRDNRPRGSRFILEFPVKDQQLAKALG